MRPTNDESRGIQIIRGIAAAAVVFIHCTPMGLPQVWCRPFFNFAVGAFLFLSGLLTDPQRPHTRRRIVKTAVPYAIWSLIYVALKLYKTPAAIPLEYLKCLPTAKASSTVYFIFVYIELTLLIPLTDRLARSRFRLWGLAVSPAEIVIMRILPRISGLELPWGLKWLMGISCLGLYTYFYLGYLLGNGLIKLEFDPKLLAGLWAAATVLQMGEGHLCYKAGVKNCGTQYKLTALMAGAAFCLWAYGLIRSYKESGRRPTGLLHLLGDCSFGIYFVHLPLAAAMKLTPLYKMPFAPLTAAPLITAASLALVLAGRRLLGRYAKYFGF